MKRMRRGRDESEEWKGDGGGKRKRSDGAFPASRGYFIVSQRHGRDIDSSGGLTESNK